MHVVAKTKTLGGCDLKDNNPESLAAVSNAQVCIEINIQNRIKIHQQLITSKLTSMHSLYIKHSMYICIE